VSSTTIANPGFLGGCGRHTHVGSDQLRPQPGSPRSNGVHVVGHRAERVVVRRAGGAQLTVLIVEVLAKLLGNVVWPLRHVPLR
jgi:hypothetical protein